MESFFDWLSNRSVSFFVDWFGLHPVTFGMGDFVFTITLFTVMVVSHITLMVFASMSFSNKDNKFKEVSSSQTQQLLTLMKERVDAANEPDKFTSDIDSEQKNVERLEIELKEINLKKNEADKHAQTVQSKDGEYQIKMTSYQNSFNEIAQICYNKEYELNQLKESLNQRNNFSNQSTEILESEKKELMKARQEKEAAQRNLGSMQKNITKLGQDLEKLIYNKNNLQQTIDETEKINQDAANNLETETVEYNLSIERRNQLELALKQLNSKTSEKDKSGVIDAFFDLEKATIRIETAEREVEKQSENLNKLNDQLKNQQNIYDDKLASESTAVDRLRQLEKKKRQFTIQLDVLREFYAQKDIKVRQELAKEQELRSNLDGDLRNGAEREEYMLKEIEEYTQIKKELMKKQDIANKERSTNVNKVEREAHEYWMKLREMERKSRDLERENDTLAKQLAAKSQKKIDMEQQILKIQVNEERKRAKEHHEMQQLRTRQEHERRLVRMRGPEGEKARTGGNARRGPQPVMHRMRQESPHLSPIQGKANRSQNGPHPGQVRPPMNGHQAPRMPFHPGMAQPHPMSQPMPFHPNHQLQQQPVLMPVPANFYPPQQPLGHQNGFQQPNPPMQPLNQNQLHGNEMNKNPENNYMA